MPEPTRPSSARKTPPRALPAEFLHQGGASKKSRTGTKKAAA